MPPPRPPRRNDGSKKKSPQGSIPEFFRLLDQIHATDASSRLQLDMARDAGLELFKKLARRIKRLGGRIDRNRARRRATHERLVVLLNSLATGPISLPRPADVLPSDPVKLLAVFHDLTGDEYPRVARELHDAGGKADVLAYRSFLIEEVLAKGMYILCEHLVRALPALEGADDDLFLAELRHHVAGRVNRALSRQTGLQMSPELGKQVDALIARSLRFLFDLLRCDPPARLVLPRTGSAYDPERHEPIPGRPSSGNLIVRATLSPGFMVLGETPRLLAKAQIYTKKAEAEVSPPAPSLPDEDD